MALAIANAVLKYRIQVETASEKLVVARQKLECETKRALDSLDGNVVIDDLLHDEPLRVEMFKVAAIEAELHEAQRWLILSMRAAQRVMERDAAVHRAAQVAEEAVERRAAQVAEEAVVEGEAE
jgi:hypothetical protein